MDNITLKEDMKTLTHKPEGTQVTIHGKVETPVKSFSRLVDLIAKQYGNITRETKKIPFALQIKEGPLYTFGSTPPKFSIILNNQHAVAALSTLDQNTV